MNKFYYFRNSHSPNILTALNSKEIHRKKLILPKRFIITNASFCCAQKNYLKLTKQKKSLIIPKLTSERISVSLG